MACHTVIPETPQLKLKGFEDDVPHGDIRKHPATFKGLKVLNKHVCLPRYAYHKWLVDWSLESAELIKGFAVDPMMECIVLVGGDLSKENESLLSSEKAEGNCFSDFTKEMVSGIHLILVYFMTHDDVEKSESLQSFLHKTSLEYQCKEAHIFLIFPTEYMSTGTCGRKESSSIVSFVPCESLKIRECITEILESELHRYLGHVEKLLSDLSPAKGVEECLEQIRAVNERLINALNLPRQHKSEILHNKEQVKKIIEYNKEQYKKKILYYGFNKEGVRIITTDEGVKEDLEKMLSAMRNLKVKIHVHKGEFKMIPLSFPLHGAKQFIRGEDSIDFSTIGSLVKRNGYTMAALTCRHALFNREHPNVSIEIDESIRNLASNMYYVQETNSIHDDLALFDINEQIIPIIDSSCEKRLLDVQGKPVPAHIPNHVEFPLVHKRGASTDLTTGLVCEYGFLVHKDELPEEAYAMLVKPIGKDPFFAKKGDSGALVFKGSMCVGGKLEVIGMVSEKPPDGVFKDLMVFCIPLTEAVDKLKRRFLEIDDIEFY